MHTHQQGTKDAQERSAAGKRVSLVGAIVNTALSAIKLIIGSIGGSAALVADGLHSLSDTLTDVMVYLVFGISQKRADRNHPWGHRRFETIATAVLAIVLSSVAMIMGWSSLQALLAGEPLNSPTQLTLFAAAISIVVNEWLYWYTVRVGEKLNSKLLIANAWHHRTDGLSSVVVLVAIIGAMAGFWWLDALAAILVSILIAKIAIEMLVNSISELVDKALREDKVAQIRSEAKKIAGVVSVHGLKTRSSGGEALLEIHIRVAPYVSAAEGHFIGEQVRHRLLAQVDDLAYVIYHIDVSNDGEWDTVSTLPTRPMLQAKFADLTNQIATQYKLAMPTLRLDLYYAPTGVNVEVKLKFATMPESSVYEKIRHAYQQHFPDYNIQLWVGVAT